MMVINDSDPPTPPDSQATQSGRKGSKKVRTGCITCKIRKVKCDEAKPFCSRCTKTGRRCDGYLDAKTMAQRRRRAGAVPAGGPGGYPAPLSLLYDWASADEKRSFHFFQNVTAPCLSGDFDGDFWRVLVLQICQTEPAVKHAVLAVSSLHEAMVQASVAPYADNDDRHSFALYQYNKSISCMLGQMRYVDARPLVPLLTCVLFVCIELMQSKDHESLMHLQQGHQILSQMARKPPTRKPELDIIKQHLVPMYTRLSLTSLLLGVDPVAIPKPLKPMTEVPSVFNGIDDVRYALYDFMDECLRFAKKSRPAKSGDASPEELHAFENEQHYLLGKLAKFNVSFSLYQSTKSRDAPPGALALIQIHVHTVYIWISTALSKNETVFDNYVSTFSAIIPLAAAFMDTLLAPRARDHPSGKAAASCTPSAADTRRFSAVFTFEMHIIAPLYFVATRCRHPLIRRAALELLRRNPTRRENVWRANVMANLAEHTIRLEELHLQAPHAMRSQSQPASPPAAALTAPIPYAGDPADDDAWARELLDVQHLQDNFPVVDGSDSNNSFSFDHANSSAGSGGSMDVLVDDDLSIGHLPIDPTLLFDASEVASSVRSYSGAPSVASSLDDHHFAANNLFMGGGGTGPGAGNSPSGNPLWATSSQGGRPSISVEPPTPWDEGPFLMGLPTRQRRPAGDSIGSDESLGLLGPPPCSAEAPFEIPEIFRVHATIIGPEDNDNCVRMFRKLRGLNAKWDIQTEWL
ncbi:hypothetical protein B0T26DRAFT_239941 [Lasiosphaeria miniovina]|uniref:Zn(2)-C6 fungal-type domain-containing protein n=1 Tax=Lasiosphaeria miniovina TaxID=1954250 RepID=A0AA40AVS5_9PEZI|nr:uncharacterized protein B0T26DRAFT_239941 [Lasiosphaeria miniovina]KAK0722907.1 hypothetical protein B0T26DRAFT_239941 [Lasiosphaeria miniovina]